MARDLFEEAGIATTGTTGPRDLFAEAGVAVEPTPPERSTGEKVYRTLLGALPGGGSVLSLMTSGNPMQDAKDAVGGAVRGAGSIGATLVAPYDYAMDAIKGDRGPSMSGLVTGQQPLSRNAERRADMDAALQSLGADTNSTMFQSGKLGTEVAGTMGTGSILANGLRAIPVIGRSAAPLANALESAGMSTGAAPTTLIGRAGDMATRIAGGAISGGAQAGLIDPANAKDGALIGGLLPPAVLGAGSIGQGIGRVLRGPAVDPTVLQNARNAQSLGYVIPPTQVRPSLGNRILEGTAGKLSTAQNASAANQEVTNRLAREALGASELSPQGIQAVRDQANAAYTSLGNAGAMATDAAYQQALQKIGQRPGQFSKDFPELVNKDLDALVQSYAGKTGFDAQSGLEAIKRLREAQRAANGPMASAAQKTEGKVQGKIANALEDVIERNLAASGKTDLLKQYRNARQTLAKAYDVEKALNATSQNVDARLLARQLEKGRPMTGELRQIAEFGQTFPAAAKMPEKMGSLPQFSPLDLFTIPSLAASGAAGLGPAGVALGAAVPVARATSRYAALSPLVQRGLTKQSSVMPGLLESLADPLLIRSAPVLFTDR